jgi:hypothetical protein
MSEKGQPTEEAKEEMRRIAIKATCNSVYGFIKGGPAPSKGHWTDDLSK